MALVGWPMRCVVSAVKAIFCETVSIQLVGKLQQCMKTQIPYETVYKSAGLLYKIYVLETVNQWQVLAIDVYGRVVQRRIYVRSVVAKLNFTLSR